MKHEEWQILVSAYHDGEVTAAEAAQVEAHIADCAECRARLAAYRRIGQAVHDLPRGVPSRQLWLRVQEKLPSRRRRAIGWRLLPLAPVLALLAIGITLFIALGSGLGRAPTAQPLFRQARAPELEAYNTAAPVPTAPVAAPQPTGPLNLGSGGDYSTRAAPPACPGTPLGLEVMSLSVRSEEARSAPGLRGVLYDAEGRGLAGITLIISSTAGWQGSVTTAGDGSFALDLPERGVYRIVLALRPAKAQADETAGANAYMLPDGAACPLPEGMAMAPLPLDIHDEAIVILRVR